MTKSTISKDKFALSAETGFYGMPYPGSVMMELESYEPISLDLPETQEGWNVLARRLLKYPSEVVLNFKKQA